MNQPPARKGPRVNEMIDAESVRVVGVDGEMVGVVSVQEGIDLAIDAGFDLACDDVV